MGDEGSRLELKCQSGVMVKLEAYYGDPVGSCSCPAAQLPLASSLRVGQCPGVVDYSTNAGVGECTQTYGKMVVCWRFFNNFSPSSSLITLTKQGTAMIRLGR